MTDITIRESARADLLTAGDVIAIYAGNPTPSHAATVEAVRRLTGGTVLIETSAGTFDLAPDDLVGVLAWAPSNWITDPYL